jgi:hypothetical protein
VEKVSIPQEKLYSPEKAKKDYFQFSDKEKREINILDLRLDLWGIPLDKEKPWNAILILGCTDSSSFNPQGLSAILQDIKNSIYPNAYQKETQKTEPAIENEPLQKTKDGFEEILEQYHSSNSSIGGMIIEIPEDLRKLEDKEGIKKISSMVSHFAMAEELSSGRCLVLFPESLDRELIAHRLKNNLGTDIPLIFSTGSPAETLQKIRPYL